MSKTKMRQNNILSQPRSQTVTSWERYLIKVHQVLFHSWQEQRHTNVEALWLPKDKNRHEEAITTI